MSVSSNSEHFNDDTESSTILDYNPNDYYDDSSLTSSVYRRLMKLELETSLGNSNKKRIYRTKKTEDGYSKKVKIEFYETPNIKDRYIVDAITGNKCVPYKVGTADEDLFFSTLFATGEVGREASLLFFDNPEQYERHFHLEVSQQIKEKWLDKVTRARLSQLKTSTQ